MGTSSLALSATVQESVAFQIYSSMVEVPGCAQARLGDARSSYNRPREIDIPTMRVSPVITKGWFRRYQDKAGALSFPFDRPLPPSADDWPIMFSGYQAQHMFGFIEWVNRQLIAERQAGRIPAGASFMAPSVDELEYIMRAENNFTYTKWDYGLKPGEVRAASPRASNSKLGIRMLVGPHCNHFTRETIPDSLFRVIVTDGGVTYATQSSDRLCSGFGLDREEDTMDDDGGHGRSFVFRLVMPQTLEVR